MTIDRQTAPLFSLMTRIFVLFFCVHSTHILSFFSFFFIFFSCNLFTATIRTKLKTMAALTVIHSRWPHRKQLDMIFQLISLTVQPPTNQETTQSSTLISSDCTVCTRILFRFFLCHRGLHRSFYIFTPQTKIYIANHLRSREFVELEVHFMNICWALKENGFYLR